MDKKCWCCGSYITGDEVKDWLIANRDIISFHAIEELYEIPKGTLGKVANNTRPLPKKWEKVLRKIIEGL
jgi:hypothetical protein